MYICFVHATRGTIIYVPVENEKEIKALRDDTEYYEFFQFREMP
jgi:hypothetical protein